MAINLGSGTISKLYLGSTEITKAYLGSTEVYSTGGAVDTYAANSISPEFVADFANDYYRVASNESTFDSALTFSRSGNATMVDSDGLIKWAPHNRFENSVTGAVSGPFNVARVSGLPDPDGGNNAFSIASSDGIGIGNYRQIYSGTGLSGLWVTGAWLRLQSGSVDHVSFKAANDSTADAHAGVDLDNRLDGTWKYFEANPIDVSSNARFGIIVFPGTVLEVYAPRYFRADLGGMVDNPETSNSYVPTTGSAAYLARRGHHVYNGTSWVNEGILVESESRTNLLLNSVPIIGSGWSVIGSAAVQSSVQTDPTGNADAQSVVATQAAFSGMRTSVDGGVVSGNIYTISVIAKDLGQGALQIVGGFAGFNNAFQNFNLANGTLGSGDGISTGRIQNLGNGWYRCSLTATATGTATNQINIAAVPSATSAKVANATIGDGFLIWAAQIEQASTPSSYIPTSGSTVTRAGDNLDLASGASVPAAAAMSVGLTGKLIETDDDESIGVIFFQQNTGEFRSYLSENSGQAGEGRLFIQFDASTGAEETGVTLEGKLQQYNVAVRANATQAQGAINGTSLAQDTISAGVPTFTEEMRLAEKYNGTVKVFRVWGADIGTAGIEEASS